MSLFLLTFFLIYGSVHAYAFWKARAAFEFGLKAGIPLTLFMLFMVLAPLFVRLSERAGFEVLPRLLAYFGYFWMGILFLFFSASLVIDLYRLFVYAGGMFLPGDLSSIFVSGRTAFMVSLLLSILISAYGYFEARNIHIERMTIRTSKIPEKIGRIRIVQISDVHLGLIVREKRLRAILKEVNEAKPDLLVSTGDLVDGQMDNIEGLTELLQEIQPRYGKFAVTGNHEFYAGLEHTLKFTRDAGFTVLRGEGVNVAGVINVAGIDDQTGERYDLPGKVSEKELLTKLDRDKFTILLKHRPIVDKDAPGLFDLQLSGHVHKGQIFPFNLLTWISYPVKAGQTVLQNDALLYVSRGSGTWGPPVRFLAPPEVTIIDLVYGD
jgi:predicted MPP superfamily phosphohydrolase